MALVACPIYNTDENQREPIVRACLQSLAKTVEWHKGHHKLYLVDDASTCDKTLKMYEDAREWLPFTLIQNSGNLGTARSVNRAWINRDKDQSALKMDSDIVIHDVNWLDKLEECLPLDLQLGIICLRRRDLAESPDFPEGHFWRSELKRLPHKPGTRVHTIEKVGHCVGSVQLYSPALLEKIGFMAQFGTYGLDDSLAAVRCAVVGMYSAFYCGVDIEHVDPGLTPYQQFKQEYAGERMEAFGRLCELYKSGKRSVWHGPDCDLGLEAI